MPIKQLLLSAPGFLSMDLLSYTFDINAITHTWPLCLVSSTWYKG